MSGRSIKHHLLASWLLSMLLAIAGGAAFSLGISYLDYSNHRQGLLAKLRQDSKPMARQVAAELLLGTNGRLDAVVGQLQAEYGLEDLQVLNPPSRPRTQARQLVTTSVLVPGVEPETMIWASAKSPAFATFVSLRTFLMGLVPALALTLSGFLIQRRLLQRYVIRPIQALSGTSIGSRPVREHWPIEIQKIAEELAESFSSREQAIFGQLARGLIHDIRTQINSIHTALQLLEESPAGSSDYPARLERLKSACSRNIPKLRQLLELSLDSSREIVLKPQSADVTETLQQSIQTVREIAEAQGVSIQASSLPRIQLLHDRIQLERVFTNLIKNAVEATQDNPQGSRRVEIATSSGSDGAAIHIEDSGPGFSDLRQAFRPLRSTKAHGYGLGLFVSRKIVEAHQGSIVTGRSDRLGGARVTVELKAPEVIA